MRKNSLIKKKEKAKGKKDRKQKGGTQKWKGRKKKGKSGRKRNDRATGLPSRHAQIKIRINIMRITKNFKVHLQIEFFLHSYHSFVNKNVSASRM